jgi:putative spermidine/putrescine transport system permease protein
VSRRSPGERSGPWPHLLLTWPAAALLVLFVVPLGAMVAVSFFERSVASFFEPGFVLENYVRALTPFNLKRLGVSLGLALLATLICVLVAVPFTYLLTRLPRRRQVPYLVLVLATLSLSEVVAAFAWSLLLSRTSGVSNLFGGLGLLLSPTSWSPGFMAVLLGFVFIALPLTILLLYPPVSRLDNELVEAAGTMGASPLRAFRTVVVPVLRRAIAGSTALVFIFVLGAYVIPQTLGRPAQWTLPVHITDQAILKSNLPLGAALAMVLLAASSVVALVIVALGGRERRLK